MEPSPRSRRVAVSFAGGLLVVAAAAWLHRPSSERVCEHVFELAQRAGGETEGVTLDACVERVEARFEARGPFAGRRMLRCLRRADHFLQAAGC